jgi:hypothetical protein
MGYPNDARNLRNILSITVFPDPAAAAHRVIAAIGEIVQKQAFVMAFSDTFYLRGCE